MKVANVHSKRLRAEAVEVGALIDTLASSDDRLWPHRSWPPMRFDRPLGCGAVGGHGPIGYLVEEYEPGARVRFRFTRPHGFDGYHEFTVTPLEAPGDSLLEHALMMEARGRAAWSWVLIFRPLHDALIEDALANAEREISGVATAPRWPLRVVLLRRLLGRRKPTGRVPG
jgi:hypothetical protein